MSHFMIKVDAICLRSHRDHLILSYVTDEETAPELAALSHITGPMESSKVETYFKEY